MATYFLEIKSKKRTLFLESPFILKAYFLFSILVTGVWLIQVLFRFPILRQIDPAWLTFFPLSYAFGLYFITNLIFSTNQNIRKERLRLAIVGLLSTLCLAGLLTIYTAQKGPLTKSVTPIISAIAIMIAWTTLLQFTSVTHYCIKHDKSIQE